MNVIDRLLVVVLNPNDDRLNLLKISLASEAIIHQATTPKAFVDLVGVSGEARIAIVSSDAGLNKTRVLDLLREIRKHSKKIHVIVGYQPHQLKLTSIRRKNVRFVAEGFLAMSAREFIAA